MTELPRSTWSGAAPGSWLARWLAACADLEDLFANHHLLDAIIEEIDGRRIRVGERWLIDFASCNYLGLDLDREVIEAIPAYLDRWGTHPSWSRMLGNPALYPEIEARLTELLGALDTLLLPTLTHIHASVVPVLASDGTIFVDARAHKTIWDGCVAARAHRGPLRPRRPRGPGAAAAPAPQDPPPGLHGRDQLDDRQPARPAGLPRPGPGQRRPAVRRRRPRVRGGRGAGPGGDQPVRPPRQRGRPPPGPALRPRGAHRRLLQGLLLPAGLRRLPARAQA